MWESGRTYRPNKFKYKKVHNLNLKQMNEICRTCLMPTDNFYSLFECKLFGNQILTLSKIMALCTGLEVSKYDNFSNVICQLCSSALLQAFDYRRKCWDSHRTLQKQCKKNSASFRNDDYSYSADVKTTLDIDQETEICETSETSLPAFEINIDSELVSTPALLENKTSVECEKIVPMKNFHLYVEYKIDKTKHFGRIFICRICSQAYENQHYMVNHFKLAHNITFKLEKEFKCKICPKVYGDQSCYLRHMRWHKDRTSYVCTYCGVTLKYKFTLEEHIRVHTGEKPYKCEYCDFSSGKRSVITVHRRTHTGERPFICHICNKKYPTTAARATHIKTHSTELKFECSICNKKFRTPGVLSTHKLIHDSSKHLECKICGKQFPRRSQLTTHMRTHTRDYCHTCDKCGKGFIQRHCWRTHMKNHHSQIVL